MFAQTTAPRRLGLRDSLMAWINRAAPVHNVKDAPQTDRDRRDFMLTMMEDHPHAFTSEADVQCMMHLYPGRF
ncbi:MAG: hypothetical protein HLUCCO18_05940 [Rhodobacteraceae bacterium HLUCCO18]|nr:MAG: hypothetical protein HLUCCO18_05940 [Rhodobacteraceae bacterium HLUCCO18]